MTNENTMYVWYGADEFDMDKVIQYDPKNRAHTIKDVNKAWDKPKIHLGLWASPIKSKYYTWKEWCESEDFNTEKFNHFAKFYLSSRAKVLRISDIDSMVEFIYRYGKDTDSGKKFTFQEILQKIKEDYWSMFGEISYEWNQVMDEYDAIEMIHCSKTRNFFQTWDCDSIFIWNKDIIEIESLG